MTACHDPVMAAEIGSMVLKYGGVCIGGLAFGRMDAVSRKESKDPNHKAGLIDGIKKKSSLHKLL